MEDQDIPGESAVYARGRGDSIAGQLLEFPLDTTEQSDPRDSREDSGECGWSWRGRSKPEIDGNGNKVNGQVYI